jgi:NAD(P)-dependent dehydrogenase (short-subunit alcohol dehydrogenase family)
MLDGFDLTGRVAVVTGGGTGIGRVTAMLLAERGADIAIAGRRPKPLSNVAASIRETTGRRCIDLPTDVRSAKEARRMIEAVAQEFGRIDILINNAGTPIQHMSLADLPAEIWELDVSLNLSAAQFCSQPALQYLSASGKGAIVNVSSLAGVNGTMEVGAYSAAKAGLQMLTRVMAAEWGPRGIRVNCVAPGMIATDTSRANWQEQNYDAMAACQSFPLRRYGESIEVAQAIAFLVSDASSYITGETLPVGGGPQMGGKIDVLRSGATLKVQRQSNPE